MPTTWMDDPATNQTPIKAAHLNELRAAISSAGGTPTGGWTDGETVGQTTPIKAQHVAELRTAEQTVWDACGLGALPGWSSGITPGGPSLGTAATRIRAREINDLRAWVNQREAALALTLSPASTIHGPTGTFDVQVVLAAGSTPVVGVQFSLDFDPTKLAVVDRDANTDGVQLVPGTVWTDVLQNAADNQAGHLAFAGGVFSGSAPSGTLTVATITFQPLVVGTSLLSFVSVPGRRTVVAGDEGALPLCRSGAQVVITP